MPSYQKTILLGHLGHDPKIMTSKGGICIASFSIYTTTHYKSKTTGQGVEESERHTVKAFGKMAEYIGNAMKKGNLCFVEGRIKSNTWTDKQNQEHKDKDIIADRVENLTPRETQPQTQQQPPTSQGQGYSTADDNDEIPF